MVQYKTIIKAIDEYLAKCLTIAQMKEQLLNMSKKEKNRAFEENNLLNEGERRRYDYLVKYIPSLQEDLIQHRKITDELYGEMDKTDPFFDEEYRSIERSEMELEDLKNELFQYERRIIEGYDKEPFSVEYDESQYTMEKQVKWDESTAEWISQLGEVEKRQILSQKGMVYTDDDVDCLNHYYWSGARLINSRLNKGKHWTELSDEEKAEMKPKLNKMERHISKTINNTQGMVQNTMVFHGGEFDVTKLVGDKVKFKGYTSSSFNLEIAKQFESWRNIPREKAYTYKLLLPKGYKGLCANDVYVDRLGANHGERELLLPKGMEGTIVDIDYKHNMVTLLVE